MTAILIVEDDIADQGCSAMFFDENARAGDWREQVLHCRDRGVSISRHVTFALAVADLLKLPDDLPLMPAVTAAMLIPACLSDPASLAHLRAVAYAAGRAALADGPLPEAHGA
jgi:hypothetical protein